MEAQRVIILGAGPTGLSLAWKLADQGVPVDVLESESHVGGLSATIRQAGYRMDLGPHSFFSDKPEMIAALQDLFDDRLEPIRRHARFRYNGRFFDYPPTPSTILLQMGPVQALKALFSHLKGRLPARRNASGEPSEESVEDWAVKNFGEHLYRTFFKPYTEQFWGIPCADLASCTIPQNTRIGFMNALRILMLDRSRRTGSSLLERESLSMYYPPAGYGDISERMAARIQRAGGEVHLECRVTGVAEALDREMRVEYLRGGRREAIHGSHVVSTIPVGNLVTLLDPPAPREVRASASRLEFRPLVVLGLVTRKPAVLDCGYIYVLDRPFNRVTDMNRFSSSSRPDGENMVLVEVPCLVGSETWKAGRDELFDKCIGSLARDGILERDEVEHILLVRAPCAYPIYHKGFSRHLVRVLHHIENHRRLYTLGRCGGFAYMDLDQCMEIGFHSADAILNPRSRS